MLLLSILTLVLSLTAGHGWLWLSTLLALVPRLDANIQADTDSLIRGLSGIASMVDGKVGKASGTKGLALAQDAGLAA